MSTNRSGDRENRDSQGALASLDTMSVRELKDLLERQNKILKNASFVARLMDKGAKLIATRDRIQTTLQTVEASELKKVTLIGSKTQLRAEDFEWAVKSLENINLNDPEQVGTGCSADLVTPFKSLQVDSESLPAGPSGSETAQFGPNELRHIERLDTQAHNLIFKNKFKPCHISNPTSATSNTVFEARAKPEGQAGNKLRWDEALLPPSSAKTVKQMSWQESFEELQGQNLKLKDQTTESNIWKNKAYAFKDLPSDSQNLSVLSKNTYDLADDSEDTESIENEEDRITEEESDTELV